MHAFSTRALFLSVLLGACRLSFGQAPSTTLQATGTAAWMDSVQHLPLAQQVVAVRARAWRDTLLAPYQSPADRIVLANVAQQATASAAKPTGFPLLYVLDGQPFYSNDATTISHLQQRLNHRSIRQVTLLRDVAAASIYGTRAANGVVILASKKL